MKKTAALMISSMLILSSLFVMLDMTVNVEGEDIAPTLLFAGGDGSPGDPYQISNVNEFQDMNNDLNASYILVNDIDANDTATWNLEAGFVPIGNDTAHFNGSFDGNNFSITNLTINRSSTDNIGLFGYANDTAVINNIALINVNITGGDYVGAIAGRNDGTITNSYSNGSISGVYFVGGFVGYNPGSITNCYSTGNAIGTNNYVGGFCGKSLGDITNCYSTSSANGGYNVGGFVGSNTGTITDCSSSGSATGTFDGIGGFVGLNDGGTITACYSTGSASGDDYVSGFVGYNPGGTITNSYSTGNANGIDDYVGGFVGYNLDGTITNCSSSGSASGDDLIGGFVGSNLGGTITNCYSSDSASGYDMIGGFVGSNLDGTISNCYSTGDASADNFIGGFVGYNYGGTITNCYSTGSASGNIDMIGGFVGFNEGGTITDCYSTGSASGDWMIGGFVGYNDGGAIMNCYSTGNATGTTDVGGFCGENFGGITSCFWDTDTSGTATGIGDGIITGASGKTTVQMKQQVTFTGWNFTSPWGIVETVTYPFLTPIIPIVTTQQIAQIETAIEDMIYAIDFESTAQPLPNYNMIETWAISTNADWLAISPIAGTLYGTPVNADVGTYWVNVTTMDTLGSEGYINYTLVVENTGPSITTADVTSTNTGALYEVDYDSSDDPSITWSVITDAPFLGIDPGTGVLSGTPSNAEAGTYNVEVTVDDGNGETDTQTFSFTVNLDTDGDGDPDATDLDDDNDGTPDTSDDFPLDDSETTDTDGDGIGNNADTDDDWDGWDDTIEIVGGFDPLDNTSIPSDADSDGIADFMDPDFLVVIEYNNQTVNQTVWDNVTEYSNNTVWNNATADLDADSDGDGWSDIVEILAGTDEQDDSDMPTDADSDGIADFMDSDFLTTEVPIYNNNTIWNNGTADSDTVTETPAWAWGAVIAAVVMGVLAVIGYTRGGSGGSKPEGVEELPEAELELEVEETVEPDIPE